MKKLAILVFAFFAAAVTSAAASDSEERKHYHGYQVLRTEILTSVQSLELHNLESRFSFWKSPRSGVSADIMAPPEAVHDLRSRLQNLNIKFEVMVEDVETLISKSSPMLGLNRHNANFDWNNYYDHDALNAYVDDLAERYPFVQSVSIGKSYENRDMRVIQIAKAGEGKQNVWIEAGIHAREWIAPAMATYIMRELVERNATNYIDNLNIHILPSANPDGYEHSRNSDRLWRKTRSSTGSILGCKGVDGNRNWDFHFDESGASDNKCLETYHGPEAFSEVEMRNIRDYVLDLQPTPILALCLHSYSQLWMYPYGYKTGAVPENVKEIKDLGEEAVKALKAVHGTVFDPINSADLYPAAGASDDWYKGVLNARFTYTVELRDTGKDGFVLPKDQIIPSGEELWAGLKVVLDKMVELSQE